MHVHRRKRDIGGDVAVSETLVELYTVDERDAVIRADLIGVQIAMTVSDASFMLTPGEPARPDVEERLGICLHPVVPFRRHGDPDILARLREVLLRVHADRIDSADPPGRFGGRSGVERRDPLRDPPHQLG